MDQIKVTLKGGVEKTYTKGVTLIEIAGDISRKLSKEAVAAKVDGVIKDIGSKLYDDCQVEILTFDDEEGRKVFWHSTSHVMAQAVKRLFPEVKLAIGPAIDEGFIMILIGRKASPHRNLKNREGNGKNNRRRLCLLP